MKYLHGDGPRQLVDAMAKRQVIAVQMLKGNDWIVGYLFRQGSQEPYISTTDILPYRYPDLRQVHGGEHHESVVLDSAIVNSSKDSCQTMQ